MADGFLLVDKDEGWTSHDVVARVRGLLRQKKVGHAGTLDPMATGLLVVAAGRSTRLLRFVQDLAKEYVARARLGVATDTLDATGTEVERRPMPISAADLDAVLPRFVGSIEQVPPMVSALKVGGRRLYQLAREGKEVARAPRTVRVHGIEVVAFEPADYPELTFRVRCGKGTYVRTLADDLARALGGRAHLEGLRRTAIGSLRVAQAERVGALERRAAAGDLAGALLAPAAGLRDLPAATAPVPVAARVAHGGRVAAADLDPRPGPGPFRLLDAEGRLLAVYRSDGVETSPEVVVG